METKTWRILRGILAFVIVTAVAFPVVFEIAITIAPNRVEGHPTMPIGQAFLAMVTSPILGAVAAYFASRSHQ